MLHRLATFLCFACLAAPLALPSMADAQATPDASQLETEARARFQGGQLDCSQARFAEAATELEAAYPTHQAVLLHDLYLARRDLGDIPGAVDARRRYLAAATDISPAARPSLEGRLATPFGAGIAMSAVGAVLFGVGARHPSSETPSVAAVCDATGCNTQISGAL